MNQSLIDDFLVFSDKIGSANFFWSFPSKAYQDQCVRKENLEASISHLQEAIKDTANKEKQAKVERCGADRRVKLNKLAAILEQEGHADEQLGQLKVNDPEEIRAVEKKALVNKAAADRWTDNIWVIKSYLTKRKGMSGKEVRRQLSHFTLLYQRCSSIFFRTMSNQNVG